MSLLAPTAPGPGRLALHMLRCRKLGVIRKHGGIPLSAPYLYRRRYRRCQGSDGTVSVERRGIGWIVVSRLQTPCKSEATSAHRCNDECQCNCAVCKEDDRHEDRHRASELPAAALGLRTRSTESLFRVNVKGTILPI